MSIIDVRNQREHFIVYLDQNKDVFKIDPLPVRGYQIMVYYNRITGNKQPKAIKHMLGS